MVLQCVSIISPDSDEVKHTGSDRDPFLLRDLSTASKNALAHSSLILKREYCSRWSLNHNLL